MRYEHLILGLSSENTVYIGTTLRTVLESVVSQVEQLVGGQIEVKSPGGYEYVLKKLRKRDVEAYLWVISCLCKDGWEPYAVLGRVHGGSSSTYTNVEQYFRREIPPSAEDRESWT